MESWEEKVILTKIKGKWYIDTPNRCTSCNQYGTCQLLRSVQELGKPWFNDITAATKLGAVCEAYRVTV